MRKKEKLTSIHALQKKKKKNFDMPDTPNFDFDDMFLHREKLNAGKSWSPELLSNTDN